MKTMSPCRHERSTENRQKVVSHARNVLGQCAVIATLIGATVVGICQRRNESPQEHEVEWKDALRGGIRAVLQDIMSEIPGSDASPWDEWGDNFQAHHDEAKQLFEEWKQQSKNPSQREKMDAEDAICQAAWDIILMHSYKNGNRQRAYDIDLAQAIQKAATPVLLARFHEDTTSKSPADSSPYQIMLEANPSVVKRIREPLTQKLDDPNYTPYARNFLGDGHEKLQMIPMLHSAANLAMSTNIQKDLAALQENYAAIEKKVMTADGPSNYTLVTR